MSPELPASESEFAPATQAELSRFMAENAGGERRPLYPVGGRTALHYGYSPHVPGIMLATTPLSRTVDYPARDLTVTVEAGMRIDELKAMLKGEGQQLPIDIPQSHRATLGGAVATNTGGARQFGYGTFRDYVIGLTAVSADGRIFHSGGRVVKNVAGYDLCKLMVGSLGTLAVVTQLTLKLRPLPEASAQVWAAFRSFADINTVLDRLLTSETRPIALDVLNREAAAEIGAAARCSLPQDCPLLMMGFEGSRRETDWQVAAVQRELAAYSPIEIASFSGDDVERIWTVLTEYQCNADDPLTFQAHLLPSRAMEFAEQATAHGVALQVHAGNGIVTGHLPDEAATVEKAADIITSLRQMARAHRGNLVLLNCDREWTARLSVFGEAGIAEPLMRSLKETLDPHDLLNPGRFFGERLESTSS